MSRLPSLPVIPTFADPLDATRIANPCTIPWQGMAGDDRTRYCGHCRQNVYNVAAMARDEALALIQNREGRLCLRLTRRADGTVVTADCWTRLRQARRRGLLAFGAMLFIVLWGQIAAGIVGLKTLRRATTFTTMGAQAPALVTPEVAPPPVPPDVVMGEAPPSRIEEMGDVKMGEAP